MYYLFFFSKGSRLSEKLKKKNHIHEKNMLNKTEELQIVQL